MKMKINVYSVKLKIKIKKYSDQNISRLTLGQSP